METDIRVKAKPSDFITFFNTENEKYLVKYYTIQDKEEKLKVQRGLNEVVTYYVTIRHLEDIKLKTTVYSSLDMLKKDLSKIVKKNEKVKILEIIEIVGQDITYPLYGNKHVTSYGNLKISGSIGKKICTIKQDNYNDFITYNRNRYYVKNIGIYMSANFIVDIDKTRSYYEEKGYDEVVI